MRLPTEKSLELRSALERTKALFAIKPDVAMNDESWGAVCDFIRRDIRLSSLGFRDISPVWRDGGDQSRIPVLIQAS
jgi:hypothetical protein